MKLLILSSLVALAVGNPSLSLDFGSKDAGRELQTPLETLWRVSDPALTYDPATGFFTIAWTQGKGAYKIALEAYDVCPNGDPVFNDANPQGSPYGYFSSCAPFLNGGNVPQGWGYSSGCTGYAWLDQADSVDLQYSFQIDSSIATYPEPLYTVADGVATVEFCMRMGLVTQDINGNYVYANFRQLKATINFDLTVEDFAVTTFYTRAIEEATGGQDLALGATATVCANYGGVDPNNPTITPLFFQGEEVCIDVCADDTFGLDADVVSIEELVLNIDGQPTIAQQVVVFNGNKIGAATLPIDCTITAGCCTARFLLENSFFPVDENQEPSQATITGRGDATVMLNGNRRKLEIRGLQQIEASKAEETKFAGEFGIMQYENKDSAGVTAAFSAAALAGVAGAALLI